MGSDMTVHHICGGVADSGGRTGFERAHAAGGTA